MIKKITIAAVLLALPSTSFAAILAKIGATTVTTEQVKSEYESLTKEQKSAVNSDPQAKLKIMDNIVSSELLHQAAVKAELNKSKDFERAMERFKKQWLVSKFMETAVEAKLTKGGIKGYYEKNKNLFDTGQVCAHHILVSDEETAKKLTEQAKEKSANFEELAKKNSIDPSVQENKGSLGCFTKDRMVPEFAAAAFSMRKNEVRGPVRTAFGYHVIKLDEIKSGKVLGFEEIEQKAKDLYRVKLVQDLIADMRKKSEVKVEAEEVKRFQF